MSEHTTTRPAQQEATHTAHFSAPYGPLAEALAVAEFGVQSGIVPPAQCGVLIATSSSTLTLTTFDFDTAATVSLPVDTAATGSSLLHHGQLKKALAAMVAGETKATAARTAVTLEGDLLMTEHLSLPISALELSEFTHPPQAAPTAVTVDAQRFLSQLQRVLPAAGTDDTLPALTGVRMSLEGQKLTMSATDRYRFAVAEIPATVDAEPPQDAQSALVPADVLARLTKRLKTYDGPVDIGFTTTDGAPRATLTMGTTTVTIRQLEGAQIRHGALFPTTADTSLTLDRATTLRALKKCHALIKAKGETGSPVSFTWAADGSLTLAPCIGTGEERARTKGMTIASTITAGTTPQDRKVALSPKFLAEALAAFDGDTITLHLHDEAAGSPLKPVLLTAGPDVTGEDYRHLLMPIRLLQAA
ncbi:DNA polymerase III subunit beta [Streptomyces sp. NPDC048680]|uniref:DNA polymerase III subunit beta n=1 Tax=Streptomyces sp. NPDC048680 TaxID=3155492 RepID=UPI00343B8796